MAIVLKPKIITAPEAPAKTSKLPSIEEGAAAIKKKPKRKRIPRASKETEDVEDGEKLLALVKKRNPEMFKENKDVDN